MQNSYINIPSLTIGNYQVGNIFGTTKNNPITDKFIQDNNHMWYYKEIVSDTRLELLAYQEYNDSKMWDILFKVNQMETLFDLPTNGDNIILRVEEFLAKLEAKIGVITHLSYRKELEDKLVEEFTIYNEKHRRFRFIKSQYISQLLGMLNG
jgi:hypothetical protein